MASCLDPHLPLLSSTTDGKHKSTSERDEESWFRIASN
jgi:hypothetical protein